MTWFKNYCDYEINEWNFDFDTLPNIIKQDCGKFNKYSIYDLLNQTREYINLSNKVRTKELIILYRTKLDNSRLFDTSSIQHDQGLLYNNILIQVASNFNCLEVANTHTNPFSYNFVSNLMYDSTQGPSAAGGAIAGTLERICIHRQNPINLLEKTPLKQTNGKLYLNANTPIDFDENNIQIGLQTNVKANFIRMNNDYIYDKNGPLINQVYTSTCICPGKNNNDQIITKKLLTSAYNGTYLSGIKQKSGKIILTLIGGGCFSNDIYHILDAIINSHINYSCYLPENCAIELPIYMPNNKLITIIKQHLKQYDFVKFIGV